MDIYEKNRLNLSHFKFRFSWRKDELEVFFPNDENEYMIPGLITKGSIFSRIFGLFTIFLFFCIFFAFIPLPTSINDIVDNYKGIEIFITYLFTSGAITWLIINTHKRYKKKLTMIETEDSKTSKITTIYTFTRSFSISDFIPLILIVSAIIVYNIKKNSEESNIYIDVFGYILTNTSPYSEYNSSIIPILINIISLFVISSLLIVIIYHVWVYTHDKLSNIVEYGATKKITSKSVDRWKYIWSIVDKIPDNRVKKVISGKVSKKNRLLETVTPDINMKKLWRVINPRYEASFLLKFILGSYLLISGLGLLDPIIYEFQTDQDSAKTITLLLICVYSISIQVFGFLLLYNAVIPLWNYYKLKKFMIKEIEKKIDTLYQISNSQQSNLSETKELLFLRDCLNEKKEASFLPFNKSFLSILLLIPLIGQGLNLLSILLI